MEKHSRVLFEVFLCLAIFSLLLTFYRYIILGDFNYYIDEDSFQKSLLEE